MTITLPHNLAVRREAIRDAVYVWVLANHPDVIQAAMHLVDAGDEDAGLAIDA